MHILLPYAIVVTAFGVCATTDLAIKYYRLHKLLKEINND